MKCLRCDETKKLEALHEWDGLRFAPTEFYVCAKRKPCRARQQALRPAKMKVNESDKPRWGNKTIRELSEAERKEFIEELEAIRERLEFQRQFLPNGI